MNTTGEGSLGTWLRAFDNIERRQSEDREMMREIIMSGALAPAASFMRRPSMRFDPPPVKARPPKPQKRGKGSAHAKRASRRGGNHAAGAA